MSKGAKERALLFRWRAAFCSPEGPTSTTRTVLLVVSNHMAPDGSSAWPGQELIADESGFCLRTVKYHLAAAEQLGWLKRSKRRRGGRESWRHGTDYFPAFPPEFSGKEHTIGAPDAPKMGHVIP